MDALEAFILGIIQGLTEFLPVSSSGHLQLGQELLNVREAGLTLHIRQLAGNNSHHILEACFKAFGRALSAAVKIDDSRRDVIPSTKGVLG